MSIISIIGILLPLCVIVCVWKILTGDAWRYCDANRDTLRRSED
jgi:hypothetical protein